MSPSEQRAPSVVSTTTRTTDHAGSKGHKPDIYTGERNKLEDWINQVQTFFEIEGIESNSKRALIACSYLRGGAQEWARPRQSAYLEDKHDPEELFKNWKKFLAALRHMYGISNEQKVAMRMLRTLVQKTSTSTYVAKFREYAPKTGYDDVALKEAFYRGLKDNVKDELMRGGNYLAMDLERLQALAIQVDDALYERAMEKRHTGQFRGRSGYVPFSGSGGQQRDRGDPMDLSNTERRPRKGRQDGGQRRGKELPKGQKKRNGPECYNCHKIGHYARDCRGKKMRPQQEVNVILTKEQETPTDKGTPRAHNITRQRRKIDPATDVKNPEHGLYHWSACHEDDCRKHYDAKVSAGWFPSKPRKDTGPEEEFYDVMEQKPTTVNELLRQWTKLEIDDDEWVLVTDASETASANYLRQEMNVIERAQTPAQAPDGLQTLLKQEEILVWACEELTKRHHDVESDKENFSHNALKENDEVLAYHQDQLRKTRKQIREYPVDPKRTVKELNVIQAAEEETTERKLQLLLERKQKTKDRFQELLDEREELATRWRNNESLPKPDIQTRFHLGAIMQSAINERKSQEAKWYAQCDLERIYERELRIDEEPEVYRKRPVREFNMMLNAWQPGMRQTPMQTRDDGHHTRGRSPPSMSREETYLQLSQTPPPSLVEVEQEIQDHIIVESQATTLGEESHSQTTTDYEIVELSPELPDSEDEYSDDEDPDDLEMVTVTVTASRPVVQIMTLISEDAGTVFPVIGDKRRLHPHRFEQLLERIRALMWHYRQVNVDWDAYSYVVDRPPIGSKFDAKTGGYTAPDGVGISRTMRERVKIIKEKYREIQQIQEKWMNDEIEYPQMRSECTRSVQSWPLVEPDITKTPVWRNMTLGHLWTVMRGPVSATFTQGRIVFSPKNPGPLSWEISMENSDSPTYFSKN